VTTASTAEPALAPPSTEPEIQEAAQPPLPIHSSGTPATANDVLNNVRHWVRHTAGRGRLAARVHFSAIPMWTTRCRAVLLALAASLRSTPIDVAAIVTQLSVLWMLPREVFTIPSRGGAAAQRRRYNRIRRRLADEGLLARLLSQVTSPPVCPSGGGPTNRHTDASGVSLDSSSNTQQYGRVAFAATAAARPSL
jgi:hypothetical protein